MCRRQIKLRPFGFRDVATLSFQIILLFIIAFIEIVSYNKIWKLLFSAKTPVGQRWMKKKNPLYRQIKAYLVPCLHERKIVKSATFSP